MKIPYALYSDNDPYAAQWTRNLIGAGLIPRGDVDERSIKDIDPDELTAYTQCHFFCGISGFTKVLSLAGWPDDRKVWTGSCPCQPFSNLGSGLGFDDGRHLWPSWFNLIRQCRPPEIFGEQISDAAVWLDLVFSDLESEGYACGASDLPAAGVGARHVRQRIWFVAYADAERRENVEGKSASQTISGVRLASSLVHRPPIEYLRGSFEPDESWIVDGLRGEGDAVSAYGNSVVPQVGAAFVRAYMECRP